jgi:hypothetical protein
MTVREPVDCPGCCNCELFDDHRCHETGEWLACLTDEERASVIAKHA